MQETLDPTPSIETAWSNVFNILYNGDRTVRRPSVSAIDYVIRRASTNGHPFMQHGNTALVVFGIEEPLVMFNNFLDQFEKQGSNDEEGHSRATLATRFEINGQLQYYVTWWFIWKNGNPPHNLVAGLQDWVRLEAGLAPGHWAAPAPGQNYNQGDRMAYFIQWLPASGGKSAGYLLNQQLRAGYDQATYWQTTLGASFNELWQRYQTHLSGSTNAPGGTNSTIARH